MGLAAPWQGVRLLLSVPGLAKWALAPAAVFVCAFLLGLWCLWLTFEDIAPFLGKAFELYLRDPIAITHLLAEAGLLLMQILAMASLVALVTLVSFILAKIFTGPFNSILADRALGALGALPAESAVRPRGFLRAVATVRLTLGGMAQETLLLACGAALFVTAWIPGLNVASLIVYFFLIAFDCMSYSLERLGYGFRSRIYRAGASSASLLGFAASLAVILFIPVVGFFAYPVGVVGAAWLVSKLGYAAREP